LCLLGGFLGITLLVVAYMEQYVWVLVFLAVVGVGAILYGFKRRIKSLKKG
jgi:O-antigen/teichoic acid export membrane protein